jgi:hypothetical protein
MGFFAFTRVSPDFFVLSEPPAADRFGQAEGRQLS